MCTWTSATVMRPSFDPSDPVGDPEGDRLSMIAAEQRIAPRSIVDRPRLRWPGDARVALWIVPNIEHYEYLPPPHPIRNAYPRMPHPDILAYGGKDYGNRAGLWRMFESFDALGLRGTVSLNLGVIEHYPEVFEACESRSWDYLGHGLYNTRYMWGVSEDHEREHIAQCVDIFRRRTGRQLQGWLSPALSHTAHARSRGRGRHSLFLRSRAR